jgi:hypothetical protein
MTVGDEHRSEGEPMDEPDATDAPVELSRAEQWTLHHVLLDRLADAEADADGREGEPPSELRRAFERLDRGETTFTRAQLEQLQTVLARYHHRSSWWLVERPRLEALLDSVSTALDDERE